MLRSLWIGLLLSFVLSLSAGAAGKPEQPQFLTEGEVRTAVERYLTEKLRGRGWQTTISQLAIPQRVSLPKGVRDLEIVAPSSWDGWGAVSMALLVRVNGVMEKNLPLRLTVDARTEMVVANRQLLAGTVLTEEDLSLQQREVAQAAGLHVSAIEDVVGMKLRSMVRSGAPVKSNQLQKVPVINNGQLVTIVAESAGFRMTVTGRAKGSGGVGDIIKVENLNSRKQFPARIVDSTTVEAGF
ncbi:flagellar basal body P-ring formation chaperone FlgA [Trichlorobacter sp.]|uniref:flagellar basal body P-ring formation chaperone FlgA n=1 Tax=Trichlorobacter sp. TaxID=2911007 RepID=UPI002A3608F9|nr:flagellar basal body P-ring formation chaperone FlgA [Trichlorobacter sp.]MDY0383177.1 flagellar basal body P-ring formation chaperone FlgA [Trichlorobacter sp.]